MGASRAVPPPFPARETASRSFRRAQFLKLAVGLEPWYLPSRAPDSYRNTSHLVP
jgi:hypothetical protein